MREAGLMLANCYYNAAWFRGAPVNPRMLNQVEETSQFQRRVSLPAPFTQIHEGEAQPYLRMLRGRLRVNKPLPPLIGASEWSRGRAGDSGMSAPRDCQRSILCPVSNPPCRTYWKPHACPA